MRVHTLATEFGNLSNLALEDLAVQLASYGQMHRVSLKGLDEQAATGADGNPLRG
jgi:hypothetical protein